MANVIQIKRSNVASAVPTASQLAVGEIAVNFPDRAPFGYIYRTTFPSGKVYVGKKHSPVFLPTYFGSGNAVRDYKKSTGSHAGLSVECLYFCATEEELNDKERKEVASHRQVYGIKCVNLCEGGRGIGSEYIKKLLLTPEYRAKLREGQKKRGPRLERRGKALPENWRKAIAVGNTGKKLSPDAIKKSADARRGRPVSDQHRENMRKAKIGRKLSPEHVAAVVAAKTGKKRGPNKKKMAPHKKPNSTGAKHHSAQAVVCNGRYFETLTQASRALGVNRQTIANRINSANYPEYKFASPTKTGFGVSFMSA